MSDPAPKPGDNPTTAIAQFKACLGANIQQDEPAALPPAAPAKVSALPFGGAGQGRQQFLRSRGNQARPGAVWKRPVSINPGCRSRFSKLIDLTSCVGTGVARRQHPLGMCAMFIHAFLALGRSTGKSDYQWLDDVITRLVA
jgi:hypothetical protein